MPRVALDLNKPEDLEKVGGQWRVGPGLVPGEPNEGLVARLAHSPARLPNYDDSGWEICRNIRESISTGFTFAWYRTAIQLPQQVDGMEVSGSRLYFETNIDNYGEIWIDGRIDRSTGVIVGINASQRVEITDGVAPGARHVIAYLVGNGPLAEPRGGIFMRFASLVLESSG